MEKIDKELLYEFLILGNEEISEHHVREVRKTIGLVLNRFHKLQRKEFDEVQEQVLFKLLEVRSTFDRTQDAYNYIFSIARHEASNHLRRLHHEVSVGSFHGDTEVESLDIGAVRRGSGGKGRGAFSSASLMSDSDVMERGDDVGVPLGGVVGVEDGGFSLPSEERVSSPVLRSYVEKLFRSVDWDFERITQSDLPEVLLFFHRHKQKKLPSYLNTEGVAERLFFVLSKLLSTDIDGFESTRRTLVTSTGI